MAGLKFYQPQISSKKFLTASWLRLAVKYLMLDCSKGLNTVNWLVDKVAILQLYKAEYIVSVVIEVVKKEKKIVQVEQTNCAAGEEKLKSIPICLQQRLILADGNNLWDASFRTHITVS